ncbi:glycosyltransferase family 2 protein [Citrobacter freundii complex sp. 2025EL-00176]
MRFSIIIPLYNKGQYISKTLESLFKQTFQDFEVIVVNDGSTDNGPSLVNQVADERVKLICQGNQGVSVARNTGAKHAVGDFLVFLDADDVYLDNALAHFSFLIDRFPEHDYFCANYYRVSNGVRKTAIDVDKILGKDFKYGIVDNFFYIASFHPGSFPCNVSTFTIRRERLIERNIYFPEGVSHTEDVYFCSVLALNFFPVFSRECVHEYYINNIGNSRSSRPTDTRFVIDELRKKTDEDKYISSFIAKNIIHLLYNCIEFDDFSNYKKHKNDSFFSLQYMLGKYKYHYLILKLLPYAVAKKLYSLAKKKR